MVEMAQQVKVLATKPDDQSLISGTHAVKEENQLGTHRVGGEN